VGLGEPDALSAPYQRPVADALGSVRGQVRGRLVKGAWAWMLPLALWAVCIGLKAADGPEEPLSFSHKVHAGDLQCKMCHPNPDQGESMTIAAPPLCMKCHAAIKTDSPAIQTLAAYAKDGKQIPWVRICQVPSAARRETCKMLSNACTSH
jgi:hypothetical protein